MNSDEEENPRKYGKINQIHLYVRWSASEEKEQV